MTSVVPNDTEFTPLDKGPKAPTKSKPRLSLLPNSLATQRKSKLLVPSAQNIPAEYVYSGNDPE